MATPSQPSVYTTDHSASVLRTHSWRTAANSAGYLLPHLRSNMKILDVGCGPGSITIDLARLVPQGHVTGVEYVLDPLEGARALAAANGVTNVSFEIGDIHCLPFEDDAFDVVHAHQVLQHISDPVKALQEMRRVTKVGGMVACRESASMTWYPQSDKLNTWYDLTTRMAVSKGGNPHPGSRIHVWAEKAGFARKDITKSAGSWCFSSDEEREYWGGSMAQRSRSSGSATMALEGGFSTREQLDKVAQGWDEFREDKDAWFGLLHGEILCRK
ncbi:S-adenosyl-L-methionine-dependent methyltransferase [Mytilinidion resinicola]|uniref:S-adenosyl-L-methionine-dependent methyltransferase n=1 Tax=Mytilinidion resinicola TaxID=574789 RepID=A0A6A6Z0K3_9PEZI|nr:S-adenosyl-L-methionine-dependent methyltransferase [Mytilinidion resinicola]KAF2814233.1 S-adenosyl-L-methionine-dependent methyltransferase [Mytilinidion resinicola]